MAAPHVAGEDVVLVEALHHVGTVVDQVHDLSPELDPLVQTHGEGPGLRLLSDEKEEKDSPTTVRF